MEKLKDNKAGRVKEVRNAEPGFRYVIDRSLEDLSRSPSTLRPLPNRVQELRNKASSSRQKAEEAKASQAANTSQNKVLESFDKAC